MKNLVALYRSFMLTRNVYLLLAAVVLLFILSFFIPVLFIPARLLLVSLTVLVLIDAIVLYAKPRALNGRRVTAGRFSNGDDNMIHLQIENHYTFTVSVKLIDELPFQFQQRNWKRKAVLKGGKEYHLTYSLRPMQRGEYAFGNINAFVTSPLALVQRRYIFEQQQVIPAYPSFQQLKRYQLMAVSNRLNETGIHRLRKSGSSMEFEQIKEYVSGDDNRNVNWKATSRKGDLMVNTFTDEKSQHIYCLIDKGRNMKMPFEGMTLLDYAINASLVLTNVALLKHDKAGLLTFASHPETFLAADRKGIQMEMILENLYRQQTHFSETDFEALYAHIRGKIKSRALLILFTNFESIPGFQRQLPYLRKIARHHLLLVVFFENTELKALREKPAGNLEDIYIKTIADKFAFEKRLIVKELQQHGILSMLTTPQQVSINILNKYIELKARQAL
ncbi:DUF58 domain-containing protein [Agriterribacter sp.]|uniref:DUF58 domain-containing protein n=1 Tax=Agriterribacter sp. TaxID=2821509 RepID=UPI002B64BCD2|nr:DUF58 domain-containing protein [Agriterribacter sp.]HTN05553.1 DUF58 domain-containing protein [Agriterribacter sp.]